MSAAASCFRFLRFPDQGRQGGAGAGDSQVRFQVSVQRSGNLTGSAWPSVKLTLIPQALGGGCFGGQSRGALPGGREPCRAMATNPMGRVRTFQLSRGAPRNKSLAARSSLCGVTSDQIASENTGVRVGYWTLSAEGKQL